MRFFSKIFNSIILELEAFQYGHIKKIHSHIIEHEQQIITIVPNRGIWFYRTTETMVRPCRHYVYGAFLF